MSQQHPGSSLDRHAQLEAAISSERRAVVEHAVYAGIEGVARLRSFMETHVFAVWDFMSLLKTLQQRLTCTSTPWLPPRSPLGARLINEMVLGEESDEVAPGRFLSHFELYLEAMGEVGASTTSIRSFVAGLHAGKNVEAALAAAEAPEHARAFVRETMATCALGTVEVAASFLLGREALVPSMFRAILAELEHAGAPCPSFRLYLERHVELDEGQHGPMAVRLLQVLCGTDDQAWDAATRSARRALVARKALWDGVTRSSR